MSINTTINGLSTMGKRLRAERERLGWSRKDMAGFGGVSHASQRSYETNGRVPSLAYLLHLTKAGADFNYLLHDERACGDKEQYLKITEVSVGKVFQLAWHMWQIEKGRVSSVDDAAELFVSLLKQVHIADDPGVDLKAQALATRPEGKDNSESSKRDK